MKKLALMLVVAALATACDKSCQSTCQRVYGGEADGCNVDIPGQTPENSIKECSSECNQALSKTGSMGDYDPKRAQNSTGIYLENEKQAAAWMDCVWEVECEQLNPAGGICPPI